MTHHYVSPLAHALAHAILQDQVNYRIAKEDAANPANVVAKQCEHDGLPVPPVVVEAGDLDRGTD